MPKDESLTPEQQAARNLMIQALKQAVEYGFSIACPGSGPHGIAVRQAFPEHFASDDAADLAQKEWGYSSNDELNFDDHPLVSEADNGVWVSAWVFIELPTKEGEDDDTGTCQVCGKPMFFGEGDIAHHLGNGLPDAIDYKADRDHVAIREAE